MSNITLQPCLGVGGSTFRPCSEKAREDHPVLFGETDRR